ncbi:XRE family transcriptional regulator [Muricauda sp. ANG21]|uniref:XRE family transcriptional regulator n=1 Tax=Allomuricauda sp. ANG21 TaxID=3042468 RepID=UPI003454B87E
MSFYNSETLKLARDYMGFSQKAFSEQLEVSQATLSNLEKGLKPLDDSLVRKLESVFGDGFFSQSMSNPNLKVHYRASATIAKKYTDLFEARLMLISNHIVKLLDFVEVPENKIPKLDLEDYELDSEYLANEIRSYMGLGRGPIKDLVNLLEKFGVIIYFFDYEFISSQNKNFDGVSFYVKGTPVILINNKIQNARKLFTIAHELLHLIAHNHNDVFISKDRDIEKEANQFASEFLAPKSMLMDEFSNLTLEHLFQLKAYWKISIGAILYKAKETVMSKDQYRRWVTRLAPYRKNEPNDFEISKPKVLANMIQIVKELFDGESFYAELGISREKFNELYSTLIEKNNSKLRIII